MDVLVVVDVWVPDAEPEAVGGLVADAELLSPELVPDAVSVTPLADAE